jgi:capsular exopolysaccharide synthesis family protein
VVQGQMIEQRSEVGADGVSTLRHYVNVLWRRKWLLIVPLVLLPAVVYVSSKREPAVYEAFADVLVNRQEAAATSLVGQTPAYDDVGRTIDTQVRLARAEPLLRRVLDRAGEETLGTRTLFNKSTVFPLANVVRFTVHDKQRDRASRLATAYAEEFVRYRRELDTSGYAATLDQLRKQIGQLETADRVDSPLYVRLADREKQLEALTALATSNVTVVQTALPGDEEQIAPRPGRNTMLAAVVGLVLGLVLIALWETLSTRPRSVEEAEGLLGIPFLGRLQLGGRSPSAEADAFHTLRTNLELANTQIGARTIVVSSLHGGEGKTTVAANVAAAFSRAGRRVLLADLDLREGLLTKRLGVDNRRGVTALARGEGSVDEAVVTVPVDATHAVDVVASGALPSNPGDLLASGTLQAALAQLQERADLVVVDVAPVLDSADAAALSTRLEHAALLLVVDGRRARRPELARARRAIDVLPIAKIGFALTEGGDGGPLHVGTSRSSEEAARRRVGTAEQAA